jgi:hypothetical protein
VWQGLIEYAAMWPEGLMLRKEARFQEENASKTRKTQYSD